MINNQSVQKIDDVELQNADDLVDKPIEESSPTGGDHYDMMAYGNENADFGLPTDILPQEQAELDAIIESISHGNT